MALILANSVFVHIPKTGGTWVTAALKNAGTVKHTGTNRRTGLTTKHASWREMKGYYPAVKERPMWCLVRNPIYWWQSFWSCPIGRKFVEGGAVPKNWCGNMLWLNFEVQMLGRPHLDDFNTYMQSVLDRHPGFVSEYYSFMVEAPEYKVGKHETLVDDVVDLLATYGEDFDEKKVRGTPPTNESDPALKTRRKYKPALLEAVIEAEYAGLKKWGYSTDPRDYRHITL